jgi:hypothetical protein
MSRGASAPQRSAPAVFWAVEASALNIFPQSFSILTFSGRYSNDVDAFIRTLLPGGYLLEGPVLRCRRFQQPFRERMYLAQQKTRVRKRRWSGVFCHRVRFPVWPHDSRSYLLVDAKAFRLECRGGQARKWLRKTKSWQRILYSKTPR